MKWDNMRRRESGLWVREEGRICDEMEEEDEEEEVGAWTMGQGKRIVLMFQCSKSQLKRGQCAFEAKSITLQTVKDVVLLQSWVQYAGQGSLKELYTLAA